MPRDSVAGTSQEWRLAELLTTGQRTPSTFASAIASQSRKVFLHFTHSPEVIPHPRSRPCIGQDMESCATLHIHQLEDLSRLLQSMANLVRLPTAVSDAAGGEEESRGAATVPRFLQDTFVLALHANCAGASTRVESTPSHELEEMELDGWLQMMLWVRYFAVFLMRQLATLHGQISWYTWYWSWAEMHCRHASFHLALVSRSWWSGFFRNRLSGRHLQAKSLAIAHNFALNRILRGVVENIGVVHSLLDRMNAGIISLEEHMARNSVLAQDSSMGFSEKNTEVCQKISNAEDTLLPKVRTIVTSAVVLLANVVQLPSEKPPNHSREQTWNDVPLFNTTCNDSVMHEVLAKLYSTPAVAVKEEPRNTHSSLDKSSLYGAFQILTQTVEFSNTYFKNLSAELHARHVPPNSRHWQRILLSVFTVTPVVLFFSRRSVTDILQTVQSARTLIGDLVRNYFVYPIKEIYGTLFTSRPGVLERRRTFAVEAETVANIIRDYHEEYYPNLAQTELKKLRDKTFQHLLHGVADDEGYALINQHYEAAIRHPIRNAICGNLLRLMLIQLTYQQLEVMRVVNYTDEVLVGNDLNFKVMSMVPLFAFVSGVMLFVYQKRNAKLRPVNRQLKLYWRSIYRVVTLPAASFQNGNLDNSRVATNESDSSNSSLAEGNHDLQQQCVKGEGADNVTDVQTVTHLNSYDEGMLLLLTHNMRRLVMEYHSGYRYLRELLEDLDDLESVQFTRRQHLLTLDRMQKTHRFLS